MLDRIEPDDKRFVFKYKKNPIYTTIQKMDVRTFDSIAKKDPDYVWELLKYLSSSLKKLNREYISQKSIWYIKFKTPYTIFYTIFTEIIYMKKHKLFNKTVFNKSNTRTIPVHAAMTVSLPSCSV